MRVAVVTVLRGFMEIDFNEAPFQIPGIYVQKIIPNTVSDSSLFNLREMLDGAEIVIGDPALIGPHWYNMPPSVKWIQSTWAGVDYLCKNFVTPSKPSPQFAFTRLGSGFDVPMAEYTLGQIIAMERHFHHYCHDQAEKKWVWIECEYGGHRKLEDLTVGILGAGIIGQTIAKYCKSLGMKVCGLVRREIPVDQLRSPFIDEYYLTHSLPDLLQCCDYICNVLPSTEATRNLLSDNVLSSCKPKARFINIGRGDVINDESLLEALRQGWIDYAVLDVFNTEPLPRDSPLWNHPRVTITPHIAAESAPSLIMETFKENLELYRQGRELKYQVDWTQGY
ncbi:glyoxylate/hydroxypyruvate reductase A-like [Corticium candelabrum]|uniref:glyoxylate/hydroxypyruvate reductase A-like n=1 Tax=Corticium candelabrum TaxID=121492 RepID=UPI002E26B0AC|nr:glyoxylate/hydroxypyruvate reductase A-like [Corticium candelabrum]